MSKKIKFNNSALPTIGVEWEFAIVDSSSYELKNNAPIIFELIRQKNPILLEKVHQELFDNTIEIISGICTNSIDAMHDIMSSWEQVHQFLSSENLKAFSAGFHPFSRWENQNITQIPRYQAYDEKFQWWGKQMLIWGIHIHVGISSKNHMMPLISGLLMYIPHLIALSASSPYVYGSDTGFASNRTMLFQQLSSAGIPYPLDDWSAFERFIDVHFKSKSLTQLNELRWDIRPSPNLGTIELRISDSVPTFFEMSAIIAFSHCLIVYLDKMIEKNITLPKLDPWFIQENKWRAARYGIDAEIIINNEGETKALKDVISDLILVELLPVAKILNCIGDLEKVFHILNQGPSYLRQRNIAKKSNGSLYEVTKSIVEELIC